MTGYSDRLNHALSFAAKHHDQQVRKGLRLPYGTRPANVALILTRYERSEDTVVAGILFGVAQDLIVSGFTQEQLQQRIGEKFGQAVLGMLLEVTERREDDDGIELSYDERRDDQLDRLAKAGVESRWAYAADLLHTLGALLADLRRTEFPESVWERFAEGDAEGEIEGFREELDALTESGFSGEIVGELEDILQQIEDGAR